MSHAARNAPKSAVKQAVKQARGFTLLEVMVAVAILGLGLTAILSGQAAALSASSQARSMSVATGLLRCKMSEVEEALLKDGFQELDQTESGPCCDGDDSAMRCTWKIEKPELPEPSYGDLDLDTDLDLAGGGLGALGQMSAIDQGKASVEPGSSVGDIAAALTGSSGDGSAAGAAAGIASMVMSMVYPDLKGIFEASTRRVTVTITWSQGDQERSIDLVQWITNPKQGGIVGEIPGEDAAMDQVLGGSSSSGGGPPPGGPQRSR